MVERRTERSVGLLAALLVAAGCLGDVEVPPEPPTLQPVTSPTVLPRQLLRGTKEAGTAVLNAGEVIVAHDEEETWSAEVTLEVGDNAITLTATRASGLQSLRSTNALIVFDPPCPLSPSVTARPPSYTNVRAHTVRGTKPRQSALLLDGTEIIAASEATTWEHVVTLPDVDQINALSFVARDAKGRDSDPVVVEVTLDRTAPALAHRYPTAAGDTPTANVGIPRNPVMMVAFDEPLFFPEEGLAPTIIEVSTSAVPVGGVVVPSLDRRTLTWTPLTALAASTTYDVTVDAAQIVDAAGNVRTTDITWSFTTHATDTDGPAPTSPTVDAPGSTTTELSVTLTGTKDAWSSVWINGNLVAPLDGNAAWSYPVALAEGDNTFIVTGRGTSGTQVAGDTVSIRRTVSRPSPPSLDAGVPSAVSTPSVALVGTKPANTSVLLNGTPVVCLGSESEWGYDAPLIPGFNDLRLQSRDAQGQLSAPILHSVNFEQVYEGTVPPGWKLRAFFNLRDLRGVQEIAGQFDTGANKYGVDAWLEGPVEAGDACVFDASRRQREQIEYVATIQHYMGTKAQHTNPFADPDYRGTDYLAALISGGVFAVLGVDASTPRRGPDGKQDPNLIGLTENDLREKIDCFGFVGVDACTQATVTTGPTELLPLSGGVGGWEPRRAPDGATLAQGDYLLWIMINLDRDPSWLDANDFETCWGRADHVRRGMHRIVRRVSLGSVPYTISFNQSEELSGPDREGSGELRYIDEEGITIYWGPPQ